jgi:hypothetical protein
MAALQWELVNRLGWTDRKQFATSFATLMFNSRHESFCVLHSYRLDTARLGWRGSLIAGSVGPLLDACSLIHICLWAVRPSQRRDF